MRGEPTLGGRLDETAASAAPQHPMPVPQQLIRQASEPESALPAF